MTLIDFSYLFIITESVCYYVNSEKLKLFLQKEKSKRQENQLKEVLAKVPTGVMVFDENDNVLMKNKEAENIVKSFHEDYSPEEYKDVEVFDPDTFFMNCNLFYPVFDTEEYPFY